MIIGTESLEMNCLGYLFDVGIFVLVLFHLFLPVTFFLS